MYLLRVMGALTVSFSTNVGRHTSTPQKEDEATAREHNASNAAMHAMVSDTIGV